MPGCGKLSRRVPIVRTIHIGNSLDKLRPTKTAVDSLRRTQLKHDDMIKDIHERIIAQDRVYWQMFGTKCTVVVALGIGLGISDITAPNRASCIVVLLKLNYFFMLSIRDKLVETNRIYLLCFALLHNVDAYRVAFYTYFQNF